MSNFPASHHPRSCQDIAAGDIVSGRVSRWAALLLAFCLVQAAHADSGNSSGAATMARRPMVMAAANPLAAQTGMEYCAGAATPWMPRSRCRRCSAWSSRRARASAAAPSWCASMRRRGASRSTTAARRRRPAPTRRCSWTIRRGHCRAARRCSVGHATGVPGAIAMLALAHRDHGRLPWAQLLDPAARQADAGFTVSPRLGRFMQGRFPQITAPDVIAYFTRPDGERLRAGDTLRNPAYAASCAGWRRGSGALYKGEWRRPIVGSPPAPHPGGHDAADLAAYRPAEAAGRLRAATGATSCARRRRPAVASACCS